MRTTDGSFSSYIKKLISGLLRTKFEKQNNKILEDTIPLG